MKGGFRGLLVLFQGAAGDAEAADDLAVLDDRVAAPDCHQPGVMCEGGDAVVGHVVVPDVGGDPEGGCGPCLVDGDLGGQERGVVAAFECRQVPAGIGDGGGDREADLLGGGTERGDARGGPGAGDLRRGAGVLVGV